MLKLYGTRTLDWNASVGFFAIFQSGQPWEVWSFRPYVDLTRSTSDTSRFAEDAGSRRTDSHWQLDLNYTQNIPLGERVRFQIIADLFNVFNKQTGYNVNPKFHDIDFGDPRDYWDPRRLQVLARLIF